MSPEAWTAVGLVGAAAATGLFGLGIASVTNRRTKGIAAQLRPNGGDSLHDLLHHVAQQVNVIEQNQATMAGDVRAVTRSQESLAGDVRAVTRRLDRHIHASHPPAA